MAAVGNDRYSHFHSPYAQRTYSNVPCFWETQPVGCVRFNCAFHHSKPRNINGLFLPPTNSAPLQQGVQGGILHPAHRQELLRTQKNIVLPIHPPVIININDDDDDEEDDEEEENCVPEWVPRTAADLEEERAIKEICYKSGEYYGIQYPHKHQSTKTVSAPRENELLPLEATEQHLQKETNHTELVKSHHYQEVQEEKGISEEPRNSPNTGTGKGIRTSDPKAKPRYRPRGQRKDDQTASSYIPYERETGRKTDFNSSEPRRSALALYPTVTITQEPKFNGSTGDGNAIPTKLNNTKREGQTKGRRGPIESIPRTDCRSSENGGIRTSDPKAKPRYQPRGQRKDDQTASSYIPYERETGRKTDFNSSEPRRSAYVVYRTVTATQEPKFSGSTAVPEPRGWKGSKQKNQFDTNRRFWTQMENYDKYTSGSYNAPTQRKRNPHAKTFSKSKTTIQSLCVTHGPNRLFALRLHSSKCELAEHPHSSGKLSLLACYESASLKGQRDKFEPC
ncbi:uncharacterized protein C12orf50-like [Harpia harpyja]|uniref:uncharacterized protein C12orf50-like n=1 Tax=Harpia harpyja TaxID=202280 RepID=UPI0022B16371|nr:uncharacterized protein C12orf50-like [Harpia harpyja]